VDLVSGPPLAVATPSVSKHRRSAPRALNNPRPHRSPLRWLFLRRVPIRVWVPMETSSAPTAATEAGWYVLGPNQEGVRPTRLLSFEVAASSTLLAIQRVSRLLGQVTIDSTSRSMHLRFNVEKCYQPTVTVKVHSVQVSLNIINLCLNKYLRVKCSSMRIGLSGLTELSCIFSISSCSSTRLVTALTDSNSKSNSNLKSGISSF
jgi:hypothetical protein